MDQNETPMQTSTVTPPEPGTHVFGSDGEEIGKVAGAGPDYFQIKQGGLFHKEDIYIPLESITGTALGGDGVMINLTKDEIANGDWSQPPTGTTGDSAS